MTRTSSFPFFHFSRNGHCSCFPRFPHFKVNPWPPELWPTPSSQQPRCARNRRVAVALGSAASPCCSASLPAVGGQRPATCCGTPALPSSRPPGVQTPVKPSTTSRPTDGAPRTSQPPFGQHNGPPAVQVPQLSGFPRFPGFANNRRAAAHHASQNPSAYFPSISQSINGSHQSQSIN